MHSFVPLASRECARAGVSFRRVRRRLVPICVASAAALLLTGCGDPVSSYTHVPQPSAAQATHLRGRVVDFVTGDPISGARIQYSGLSTLSSADGLYQLTGLPIGAGELISSRTGYDTLRTHIPLPGGDYEHLIRLHASASLTGSP